MAKYVLGLCCCICFGCALGADDVVQNAVELSDLIKAQTGNAQVLNTNLFNPIVTDKELTTFDGKTSFPAQIACQGSNAFLRLRIQPRPTGDIKILSIEQDTNFDGRYDTFLTPPWLISGICANGFVQCNAGSWEGCQSFQWVADKDKVVSAQPTSFSDLGGCYCINNHCGTGLAWSNINAVLSNLGGGGAGALAQVDPFYTIGDINISDTSITFYGQDSVSCKTADLSTLIGNNKTDQFLELNKNPNQLNQDAIATSEAQPLFNRIKDSQLNAGDTSTFHSCTITRHINMNEARLNDIIGYETGEGGLSTCGSDCLTLTLGKVGQNYWQGHCTMYEHNTRFYIKEPDRILSAKLVYATFDDWIQVRVNHKVIWSGPYNNWDTDGPQPGPCELSTNWEQRPNIDFTQYLKQKGPVDFHMRVEVDGLGQGYARARIKVDTACHLEPDIINNNCLAYQELPECALVEESLDDVMTYQDYAATGLKPLPQTRTIQGSRCASDVKREWFVKKRRYLCHTSPYENFDQFFERKDYIERNTTSTGYEDRIIDPNTGEVSYQQGSLSINRTEKIKIK